MYNRRLIDKTISYNWRL